MAISKKNLEGQDGQARMGAALTGTSTGSMRHHDTEIVDRKLVIRAYGQLMTNFFF